MERVIKMSRFQLSQTEYNEIRACEAKTRDKKTSKNLRILMLRYEGVKVAEIAKTLGIRINTVSRLCTRYRTQGLEEFMRNKYTSHYRLPSEEKETEIIQRFTSHAEAGHQIAAREIKEMSLFLFPEMWVNVNCDLCQPFLRKIVMHYRKSNLSYQS